MDRFKLMKEIMKEEGFSRHSYMCPRGKNTIGYGRNLDDKGVSEGEAVLLLQNDISEIEGILNNEDSPIPWYRYKPSYVQEVLAHMAYNLGIKGLLSFKKTLELIEANKFAEASVEMLMSKWARQVGARARRLSEKLRTGKNHRHC